jgi:hypothetical protein
MHPISVGYAGNARFAGGTAGPLTVTVNLAPAAPTSITFNVSPTSVNQSDPVTITAMLSSSAGTPTGSVAFMDGTSLLADVPIGSGGTATLTTTSLAPGAHSLTVVYPGNSSFKAGAAGPITVTVAAPIPQPAGNPTTAHKKGALVALTIPFTVALNPSSAVNKTLYRLLGGVTRHGKTGFTKVIGIRTITASTDGRSVTISLSKSYKGQVQVTVLPGLTSASGTATTSSSKPLTVR